MIYNHRIGSIYHLYTTYILPSGWLYATYHLLREPGNSIDITVNHLRTSLDKAGCLFFRPLAPIALSRSSSHWSALWLPKTFVPCVSHYGSMGRGCIFTYMFMLDFHVKCIGKCTIHGSYRVLRTQKTFQLLPSDLIIIQIEVTFFPLKRSLDKAPKAKGHSEEAADG